MVTSQPLTPVVVGISSLNYGQTTIPKPEGRWEPSNIHLVTRLMFSQFHSNFFSFFGGEISFYFFPSYPSLQYLVKLYNISRLCGKANEVSDLNEQHDHHHSPSSFFFIIIILRWYWCHAGNFTNLVKPKHASNLNILELKHLVKSPDVTLIHLNILSLKLT